MPKCTYALGIAGWISTHVMKLRTNIHVYMSSRNLDSLKMWEVKVRWISSLLVLLAGLILHFFQVLKWEPHIHNFPRLDKQSLCWLLFGGWQWDIGTTCMSPGADEKQMPGCHTKPRCLHSQPAPAHVGYLVLCCYSLVPKTLICFSPWIQWISHCSESQTFSGKADPAVPVQDQEHAWTVKLLIPGSARVMMCSVSSSTWKTEDGVEHLGWDGAVPNGNRAKGQVYPAD